MRRAVSPAIPAARPLAPPAGMRDLLYPASIMRRALGRALTDTFALWGYELLTTPPFEHAEVMERGLSTLDRRDLVRFVEPETGEVALLRPDITPQIARIVATRLADRPPPFRLSYEGSVIRRRRGRARRHRQIAQAGVEHIGSNGVEADSEIIELALRACEAVGLDAATIELGQASIGREALARVPEAHREKAAAALGRKDGKELEAALRAGDVRAADRRVLLSLLDLWGGVEVLEAADGLLTGCGPAIERALAELVGLVDRLASVGLAHRIGIDLGELRGMSYYTGVSFTILAEGPGEPVGAGGRYDNLLGGFGRPAPATGFAIDLDNLEWALARADRPFLVELPLRVAVLGTDADACAAVADALRRQGVSVASLPSRPEGDALAFARAWGYDAALLVSDAGVRAVRTIDGTGCDVVPWVREQIQRLAEWARAR